MTYNEEQYNDVLRSTAAEMQTLIVEHEAALKTSSETAAAAIKAAQDSAASDLQAEKDRSAIALKNLRDSAASDLQAEKDRGKVALDQAKADLAEANVKVATLEAFRVAMVKKVQDALASNDPAQIVALGVEFLTPEQEKKKAALAATIAKAQAELDAISTSPDA